MSTLLYGANVFANDIRQHYLRYGGKGPVVLVAPGITSPAVTWGFVAERLGLSCDVYVLDIRGRGLSSSGDGLDYGLDAMAGDLIAFSGSLGLAKPAVLGHSMGARIALRAAVAAPQTFSRLAIVDPPVAGPGRRPYPTPLSWYVDSIRLSEKAIDLEGMRTFSPSWTDEHLRIRAEWLHTCYEPAIVAAYEGFHNDDIFPDFAKLKTPALLMAAGKGGVIADADEAEMRGLCPEMRFVRVRNAGHMIPWDDFDGFFAALGDFPTA